MRYDNAERDVRAFAEEFPLPSVLRGVALCESGRLSWEAVAALFAYATQDALFSTKGES